MRLRGRASELEALQGHLAALRTGRGGVVLVLGGAGAGKTSLLASAFTDPDGVAVYRGEGDRAAEMIPLGPLLGALLTTSNPVLDPAALRHVAGLPDQRFWLMQELQDRLELAAQQRPVAVVLDDVHWADPATLLALRTLTSHLSTHAILWVLALRSGQATTTVAALQGAGADTLNLSLLRGDAVAEIVADVLGGAPEADVMDAVRDVGGRPFLLLELLRGLRDEGLVTVQDGRVALTGTRVPRRFRDTVAARLEELSGPAREAVEMASVLGRSFAVDHLAALLDRAPTALIEPLSEALGAEVLVEDGDRLRFRHELLREAVDAGIPATARAELRRQAAALLMRQHAPAIEVAGLLIDVAEPGDTAAIDLLRRAAADLAGSAPPIAARLIRRAVELLPPGAPERPSAVAEAVPLLFAAGAADEARRLADSTLASVLAPDAEATIRLGLAQIYVHFSSADAVRECAAALALPGLPAGLRLRLRVVLTFAQVMNGDYEELEVAVAEDLAAAQAAQDLAAERAALANWSTVSFNRHRCAEAIAYADRAQALSGGPSAVDGQPFPRDGRVSDVWGAWIRGATGRMDEALPWVQAGLQAALEDGRAPDIRWWLSCHCRLLLNAGRLGDARASAEAVLELFAGLEGRWSATKHARYVLGCVGLRMGDQEAMREATAAAAAMQQDASTNLRRSGAWLAAQLAAADGDHQRTMELLEETIAVLGDLTPTFAAPPDPCDPIVLVRLVLRAGARAQAEAVVEEIERRAAANPEFPLARTLAVHARGLLEADADAMRSGLGALTLLPGPLARADAIEDAAGIVARDSPDEGVTLFDRALALYADAGAERDAARVRQRLRDLGVRRRRTASARPTSGWEGLTNAERAVVDLVAQGATNRQVAERLFLSPHTVNSHLRHAFSKLDIRSRVDLAVRYPVLRQSPRL